MHGALGFRAVDRRAGRDPANGASQRLARVGEDQLGIEVPGKAHAGALAARALLAIERKQARIEGFVADAAVEAEKPLIENLLAALGDHVNDAVAQAQPLIDHRFDLAAAGFGFADDDVDVVFFEAFESVGQLRRAQVHELAVDARPAIAQPARAGDHFFVKTFAAAHDRTQNQNFFAAVGAADAVEDLAARQRVNLPAALHAVLFADLRVEQTQVVINLGDRGDGGFFSALAETLLDGDGRRNAGDIVDVGPRHDFEKLARVGGQAVEVAPLAFGVNDVEGERRFARAAQTGEDDETVARNIQADVF